MSRFWQTGYPGVVGLIGQFERLKRLSLEMRESFSYAGELASARLPRLWSLEIQPAVYGGGGLGDGSTPRDTLVWHLVRAASESLQLQRLAYPVTDTRRHPSPALADAVSQCWHLRSAHLPLLCAAAVRGMAFLHTQEVGVGSWCRDVDTVERAALESAAHALRFCDRPLPALRRLVVSRRYFEHRETWRRGGIKRLLLTMFDGLGRLAANAPSLLVQDPILAEVATELLPRMTRLEAVELKDARSARSLGHLTAAAAPSLRELSGRACVRLQSWQDATTALEDFKWHRPEVNADRFLLWHYGA